MHEGHETVAEPKNPPEMTVRAMALGFAIGLVLTAAITYLALYSGLAISAAIPAALVCTGIMRVAVKRASVLENNLAQTIASSGEALAVGVVFTIPALVLAGVRKELNYWEVSLAAALGGVLGVLFTIPLRRALILESPELRYPESVACAKISEAGDKSGQSLLLAGLAVLAGAVFKSLVSIVQVISGTVEGASRIGGRLVYGGADISLALVGVGVIVQIELAWLMLLGGAISWLVAIPLVAPSPGESGDLLGLAWDTWRSDIRFIGIGAMIVGGFWAVVQARQSIVRGVKGALAGLRGGRAGVPDRTDTDLPMGAVTAAIGLVSVGTFAFMQHVCGEPWLALLSTVLTVGLAFLFTAVSTYIVGFVGSSNNPISGMAICAFLSVALMFVVFGARGSETLTVSALFISVFVCTATATAGDTAQHLKAGAILGGTPRRLQVAQLLGVVVFAFVVAPIVVLLQHAYGIGTPGRDALKAPQAAIFANLARAVFTSGDLPRTMLAIGAGISVTLIVLDTWLKRKGGSLRLYPMAVAIGMYLPFSLSVPLFLGGVLEYTLRRSTRHRAAAVAEAAIDRAVLLSSGLITGEAVVGVSAAVPKWLGWNLPVRVLESPTLSLAALALVMGLVFYFSYPAAAREGIGARLPSAKAD